MGAHNSKDPRFRSSIERGSRVFRKAALDGDNSSINHPHQSKSETPGTKKSVGILKTYGSLDDLSRKKIAESSVDKPEELAKSTLWAEVGYHQDKGGFRPRSSTYDGPHDRHKHLSVHFASNLVTTRPSSRKSTGDIHLKGILRHESVYEPNRRKYELEMRNLMNESFDEFELHNARYLSHRHPKKHKQRSSSLENVNIRTKTQKTLHTDFTKHHQMNNSPATPRKSRKDIQEMNYLVTPRLKGTGSRYSNGANSPNRSPMRNSPAKLVKTSSHLTTKPHGSSHSSASHASSHGEYPSSPFTQRRLMLVSL